MNLLTDAQVNEVVKLLLEIEKADSIEHAIAYAEKIRVVMQQAEHVTLKFEC